MPNFVTKCPHTAGVLVLLAASCGPSDSRDVATGATGIVDGQLKTVIVDPNRAGQAPSIFIEEVRIGRLVDIYDSEDRDGDPSTAELRSLQARDFLIGEGVEGDGVSYLLGNNPVTQRTELTILADADGDYFAPFDVLTQREKYQSLFDAIADSAETIPDTAIGPTAAAPFPVVPRNAAMAVRFSDLLDHATIGNDTIHVSVSSPPTARFEARVIPDPNHGAFLNGVFFTTRVLIDTTISEIEALGGSVSPNSKGMPASVETGIINGAIRVPSVLSAATGQFRLLRNLTGHGTSFSGNGPTDSNTTRDVVRGFRTGGAPADPFNGYLRDNEPPRLRGVQSISIPLVAQAVAPNATLGEIATGTAADDKVFLATIDFDTNICAVTPDVGDLLVLTGIDVGEVYAEVTRKAAPHQSGTATDVRVKLLRFPENVDYDELETEFLASTFGRFESTFRPGPGVVPECLIEISPPPGAPPTGLVTTRPRISLRFSEAIDPDSIRPFDNFRVDHDAPDPPLPDRIVVGEVTPGADLREFRYVPVVSLDHAQSTAETYFFNLVGGADGVTDLAGNPLVNTLPADIQLTVNPSEPDAEAGGIVLRFNDINEFGLTSGGNPIPEIRGQFLRDLAAGTIRGRNVSRMTQVIDKATAPNFNLLDLVAPMTPTLDPTPINHLGSRLMTVWRYGEAGFEMLDEDTLNIDVEGLYWQPIGGTIATDFFDELQITLTHSSRLPDDALTPTGGGGYAGTPLFPNSGLQKNFDDNVLVDPDNLRKTVYRGGYLLDPMQLITTDTTGSIMMPFPLNRGIPTEDFTYYTWRDTAITGRAGDDGGGAHVFGHILTGAFGIPNGACLDDSKIPAPGGVYGPGSVRSLALPLLLEFKCFPDSGTFGLNAPTTVGMFGPVFRAYSSGSPTVTSPITKDPDAELTASGTMSLVTGTLLPGTDAVAYAGQLDLVVRVSRIHTRWFDTGASSLGFPDYGSPVLEPRPDEQPLGTKVVLAFRGADTVSGSDRMNGSRYDEYGDPLGLVIPRKVLTGDGGTPCVPNDDSINTIVAAINVTFTNGDTSWKSNIDQIDGSNFFQVRITLVGNAATTLVPTLSTFAVPFRRG